MLRFKTLLALPYLANNFSLQITKRIQKQSIFSRSAYSNALCGSNVYCKRVYTVLSPTDKQSAGEGECLQVGQDGFASKRSQGRRKTKKKILDAPDTKLSTKPHTDDKKALGRMDSGRLQSLQSENAALREELAALRAQSSVASAPPVLNKNSENDVDSSIRVRSAGRKVYNAQDIIAQYEESPQHVSTLNSSPSPPAENTKTNTGAVTDENAKSKKHRQAKMASRVRKAEALQEQRKKDEVYLPPKRSELSPLRQLFHRARQTKSYQDAVAAAQTELMSGSISSEDGLTAINIFKHARRPESCLAVLDSLRRNDRRLTAVHYTSTIASFNRPEHTAKAMALLAEMEERGIVADVITYNSAISACEKAKQGDLANQILERMAEANLTPNVKSYNGAISANGKARNPEKALALFQSMREAQIAPNTITYNVVIAACGVSKRSARAVELLREMETEGFEPNVITYNAVISACNADKWHAKGLDLLKEMREKGIKGDTGVYNTALWLCVQGNMPEAVCDLLSQMYIDGVRKDNTTRFAAKEACAGRNSTVNPIELAHLLGQ